MPEDVEGVFEAYSPIMRIRSKSKSRISKINARLEEYGLEGVLEAIRNCTEALENPEHYWSHRYPIEDFMTPRNIDRFLAMNGRIKANQEESLATAKEELRHYAFYYPEEVERRCARLAEIDAQELRRWAAERWPDNGEEEAGKPEDFGELMAQMPWAGE
jgi:hypothetical protein